MNESLKDIKIGRVSATTTWLSSVKYRVEWMKIQLNTQDDPLSVCSINNFEITTKTIHH